MRIVPARTDGKVHYIDAELGDLFFQGGKWWVVTLLGDVEPGDDGTPKRIGGSRPATVEDAVGLLSDVQDRLTRIERHLSPLNRLAGR